MTATWTPAYIGVGANLDDPIQRVRDAFAALAGIRDVKVIARSRLYRTAPLGPANQPEFINAAAALLTQLSAADLLSELKALEQRLGRGQPIVRWGPRRIDFDLLVFGSERIATNALTVPHPGVPVRNFVLYPLRDIAPELVVPGLGRVQDLAARVVADGIALL